MNLPLLSLAFAAGVLWVQQQATVGVALIAGGVALGGGAAMGVLVWRYPRAVPAAVARTPVSWLQGALAVLTALALGVAWADWRASVRLADALAPECERCVMSVTGVVRGLPEVTEGWNGPAVRFELDVEAAAGQVPHRVVLTWPDRSLASGGRFDPPLAPGQRWTFEATLRPARATANPFVFEAERWWFERGIRAVGTVRSARWLGDVAAWEPRAALDRARAHIAGRLRDALEGQRYAGVIVALVVGDQRGIAPSDWAMFNRTGVSHLLAISGLHVTMLAALAAWWASGLWRMGARRGVRWTRVVSRQQCAAAVGWAIALVYAGLAGFGVPAQRTVWMLGVVAVAWVTHRRAHPWHVLACAGAVVLIADPWAIASPGFWLSFGAVAALMAGAPDQPRSPRSSRWAALGATLGAAARAQAVVSIALAPASMVFFQQVSLVGPLANAIAIPIVSFVVTPLALAGGALGAIVGWAGPAVAAHTVLAGLAEVLNAMDHGAWSSVRWPTPSAAMVVLSGVGLVLWMAPRAWPGRAMAPLFLLPLLGAGAAPPAVGTARVWALDVGQGSAVLIETAAHRLLFDAGPRHGQGGSATGAGSDAGQRVIVPFMRAQGWNTIDTMVLSHADLDHIGGAASVLGELNVGSIISGEPARVAAMLGREATQCEAGQTWAWEGVKFEVLHPSALEAAPRPGEAPGNRLSCVLRVEAAGKRLLLTADIGVAEEAALIQRAAPLHADVMVVPHHGSAGSSSAAFIAAVAPHWAVIQVGEGNRFGHPRPEVLDRYRSQQVIVVRTDEAGAVSFTLAPSALELRGWRQEAPRYWRVAARASADGTNLDKP